MKFTPIDRTTWERNSHYDYYTNLLKCGYSVTVSLDITKLHQQVKEKGLKFYPAFVYCVSKQIAVTKEFRMGRDKEGNPGYYDILHPNYTIFHEDDHTFSDVWTGYTEDFKTFYKNMRDDMETYKDVKAVKPKPGQPLNFYCISMVPWLNFVIPPTQRAEPRCCFQLLPAVSSQSMTGYLQCHSASTSPTQPLTDITHPCLSTNFRN